MAARPLVFNAIPDLGATRPEFLDRALIIDFHDIRPSLRRDERQFWGEFEAARPPILGALLDAMCGDDLAGWTLCLPHRCLTASPPSDSQTTGLLLLRLRRAEPPAPAAEQLQHLMMILQQPKPIAHAHHIYLGGCETIVELLFVDWIQRAGGFVKECVGGMI
jgi:hypothetical protein